jgi:hypothetical protein
MIPYITSMLLSFVEHLLSGLLELSASLVAVVGNDLLLLMLCLLSLGYCCDCASVGWRLPCIHVSSACVLTELLLRVITHCVV